LRIGHCTEIATPAEGEEAEEAARAAGREVPLVTLDVRGRGAQGAQGAVKGVAHGAVAASSVVDALTRHSAEPLVRLHLLLPEEMEGERKGVIGGQHGGRLMKLGGRLGVGARQPLIDVEPRLRAAMRGFRNRCADLTSGPACNNICS